MKIFMFILSMTITMHAAKATEVDNLLSQSLEVLAEHPEAIMQTVTYQPGESSDSHRHNAHVFVYILEGTVRMQVSGGEVQTLEAGDTFYENPDDIHTLSENASTTDTATFLVLLIKETDAPALIPEPALQP